MDLISTSRKLPNLTSLRAIAAMFIFIYHLYFFSPSFWNVQDSTRHGWANLLIGHFDKAVPFFFVLSGFLVWSITLDTFKRSQNKLPPIYFLKKRFLRIWPLFLFILLIGYLGQFMFDFPAVKINEYVNLSFPFSLIDNSSAIHPFLTPLWSVAVEEHIYIILFSLLIFRKFRNSTFLFIFCCLLIFLSIIDRLFFADQPIHIYYHTFACSGYLGFGGLMACIVEHPQIQILKKQLSRSVMVLSYLIGLFALFIASTNPNSLMNNPVFELLFFGCMYALIIHNQAFSNRPLFEADKLFGFKFMGRISYGFYVYSSLIIFIFNQIQAHIHQHLTPLLFTLYVFTAFLCSLIVSWMSYTWFESKFHRILPKQV